MARRRVPVLDRDAAQVEADRLRAKADVMARGTTTRAEWLRCVADGYEQGAITSTEDVWRPPAPPSASWSATNGEALAWLADHGQPAAPPEAFRM